MCSNFSSKNIKNKLIQKFSGTFRFRRYLKMLLKNTEKFAEIQDSLCILSLSSNVENLVKTCELGLRGV